MSDLFSLVQEHFEQDWRGDAAYVVILLLFLFSSIYNGFRKGFNRADIKDIFQTLLFFFLLYFSMLVLVIVSQWVSINYPKYYPAALVIVCVILVVWVAFVVYKVWQPLKKSIISKLRQPQTRGPVRLVAVTNTAMPVRAMQLKLTRTKRARGILGNKVVFALDARVDLSTDEQELVRHFGLGGIVVYESQARRRRNEAAYAHFDSAVHVAGYDAAAAGRSLWRNARGLASSAMMALSLRVTVNSLIGGQHIECRDLNELLGAEAAIVEACKNLKGYLDTALTFDGREEVLEF